MTRGRLEAFSDGVIAILITIMVLELHTPHGDDLHALWETAPALVCYAVSFVFLGIYWNNHHHMIHLVERVDGRILWANLHLLFWLSLVPFTTAWVGDHLRSPLPTAVYGAVLLAAGVAWLLLTRAIIARHGADSVFARAIGADVKGRISAGAYVAGIALSFVDARLGQLVYLGVALMWLVPDRRFERAHGGG